MKNLYQKTEVFRLAFKDKTIEIAEPVGWDKVNIILKRDKDFHGLDYEFSDGTVQLIFTNFCGREDIMKELAKFGNDAEIIFQFGYFLSEEFIPYFDGYLDFTTKKITNSAVECSVKRKTLNDLIETRYETPVTLTSLKTIDEEDMPEMPGVDLLLHSKAIIERFLIDTTETVYQNAPFMNKSGDNNGIHQYYITPDYSKVITSEIQSTGTNAFGTYESEPISSEKWDFLMRSSGVFKFKMNIQLRFGFYLTPKTITIFGGSPKINGWQFEMVLVRKRGTSISKWNIGSTAAGYVSGKRLDLTYAGSLETDIDLQIDDKLFIYGFFKFDGAGEWRMETVEVWQDKLYINITGQTEATPTPAKSFLIHEAVERVVKSISNNRASFKSNLLGRTDLGYDVNGCGAFEAITNGYQIRKFDIANRPVIASLKDLVEALNAWLCVGVTYEYGPDGSVTYRLERVDYFYRDVEIMTIDDAVEYYEETDADVVYNELEIGYAKYPEDDVSTLDEFNTKHSYIVPIKSVKKKLSILSKIIKSGYAIELTRRKQYLETPVDSWKYDEDLFGITCVKQGDNWTPEKDEAFEKVENVISPETSYNLRRSPKRMLLAWAPVLNSAVFYKQGNEKYKNTFYAKNGDLLTQFNDDATCNIGDPDKIEITEKQDLTLYDSDSFDMLWRPEKIYVKAPLTYEQIDLLRKCHQNQDDENRNYGYIRIKDGFGEYQSGFLMNLEYNPVTEICTLVLRKKYANFGNSFNCTDYADWDFSQFEAATGLSPEIEQCKFEDFN